MSQCPGVSYTNCLICGKKITCDVYRQVKDLLDPNKSLYEMSIANPYKSITLKYALKNMNK